VARGALQGEQQCMWSQKKKPAAVLTAYRMWCCLCQVVRYSILSTEKQETMTPLIRCGFFGVTRNDLAVSRSFYNGVMNANSSTTPGRAFVLSLHVC